MSQLNMMALSELKAVSAAYSNITHDILAGIVNAGELVFGVEFKVNNRNHSFEALVPSEIGNVVLVADRDLNAFAAWSTAVIPGSEIPLAKAFYEYDGKVEETFHLIRDPELKAKLRAWFDGCTEAMLNVLKTQSNPQNATPSQPVAAVKEEKDIPHVDAEIVSEG